MNRTITLLIGVVVLVAMLLIIGNQLWETNKDIALHKGDFVTGAVPTTESSRKVLSPSDSQVSAENRKASSTHDTADMPVKKDNISEEHASKENEPATATATATAGAASSAPTPSTEESEEVILSVISATSATPAVESSDSAQKKEATAVPSVAKENTLAMLGTAETRILFDGSAALLEVTTSAPAQYKMFVLTAPDRAVLDLLEGWKIKGTNVPSNLVIKNVRVGQPAERSRIVLDLKKKPSRVTVERVSSQRILLRVE